jgi:hypothetical protein
MMMGVWLKTEIKKSDLGLKKTQQAIKRILRRIFACYLSQRNKAIIILFLIFSALVLAHPEKKSRRLFSIGYTCKFETMIFSRMR